MNKLISTYFLIFFFAISTGIAAQSHDEPYAELLTDSISLCSEGTTITIDLRIKFYGDSPFKVDIEINDITYTEGLIRQGDMVDDVWETDYNFSFEVDEGEKNRIGAISIKSVTDGNSITNIITDQEIPLVNWRIPEISAGADIDSCGLTATLDASPSTLSDNYFWETPGVGNISDTTNPNTTFEALEKGESRLVFTQENGACIVSDTVDVTLRGSPSATISTATEVCGSSPQEATIDLSFEGDGPWEYSITDDNNTTITNSSAEDTITDTTNVNGQTTFAYAWVKDNNNCYASPADIAGEATVIDLLPVPNAGNDTAVCGNTITLDASISEKAEYGVWEAESGRFPDDNTNTPGAKYEAANWGEQTLTWTEFNGLCTASDNVTIRFDEKPTADAGEDITLYHQYQTMLHAREPLTSSADWLGEWYIISGTGNVSDATSKDASISGIRHGQTTLEWSVINGVCPEETDTIVITVNDLTYYTGISPDAATNKFFKIKGAHTIANNELVVFDQNGQLVYRKQNLEENNQWNATGLDGKPLSSGIYYFIFRGEGIEPVKDYLVIKRQ